MQKNSQNFSMHDAMRLARSDAGQQLLKLLQQSDSNTLQQAADLAAAGDYQKASASLAALLDSPDVQALLKQLET